LVLDLSPTVSPTPSPTPSPAQNPQDVPRLDEAALERLREIDPDGRHGVVQRVLQAFERSLEATLVQLMSLADPADPSLAPESVRVQRALDIGHLLKSSAASVGALALAEVSAQVEQRQRSSPGVEIEHDLRRLITESKRALVAVRAILPP